MKTIPKLIDCKPGIMPTEYNVLIIPEDTEEVTSGGIILSTKTKEDNDLSTMKGRLIAVSPLAFSYSTSWGADEMPKVGDAVVFAKYAGTLFEGADGKEYRLCKDKDVAAILAE